MFPVRFPVDLHVTNICEVEMILYSHRQQRGREKECICQIDIPSISSRERDNKDCLWGLDTHCHSRVWDMSIHIPRTPCQILSLSISGAMTSLQQPKIQPQRLFGTLCTVYLEQSACLLEGHVIKKRPLFYSRSKTTI